MTSIIILTYNRLDCTKKCIEAITDNAPYGDGYEIVVVDNGSTDGTREWLEAQVAEGGILKLHLCQENIGVPAGWNIGIELATSDTDYYVILNNDVYVTPGWLEKLMAVITLNPLIGMVGPMTNEISGPQLRGSFPQGWNFYFWRLVGFCLLIKGEVLRKVGEFDERFGRGNFEDDDYSVRVIQAGYKNVICGGCFVYHDGSASWEPGALEEQLIKNKKIFDEKWPADKLKEIIG